MTFFIELALYDCNPIDLFIAKVLYCHDPKTLLLYLLNHNSYSHSDAIFEQTKWQGRHLRFTLG